MAKEVGRIQLWTLTVGLVFLGLVSKGGFSAGSEGASFGIAHAPITKGYGLMPEKKVALIFRDKIKDLPKDQDVKLAKHLIALCRKHRFDPALILSLIQVESSFRPDAVSPVGAIGLMQLMPGTARFAARMAQIKYRGAKALHDPFHNIELGIAYLAFLRDKYRNLPPYFHLAAYNIGPARLDQLLTQKRFRPTATKLYYEKIRKGVSHWHQYGAPEKEVFAHRGSKNRV